MLLVAHTGRPAAIRVARVLLDKLIAAGITVRVLESEAEDLGLRGSDRVPVSPAAAAGVEMVLVVGGDGTLLRAAELAQTAGPRCLESISAASVSWPRPSQKTCRRRWRASSLASTRSKSG